MPKDSNFHEPSPHTAKELIPIEFYTGLFPKSLETYNSSLSSNGRDLGSTVKAIASERLNTRSGLTKDSAAVLLQLLRHNNNQAAREIVINAARVLRSRTFGNKFAAMVPIEMSSFCASNCTFCGWRADNREMVRLKISANALQRQVSMLAEMGFSHFEIASGDELGFIKNELGEAISVVKTTAAKTVSQPRVSICVTPLLEQHYRYLKTFGLDTVLTWQETYDSTTFNRYVTAGPKAKGITEDFRLDLHGNGHLARMRSQEFAVRAGLQVGLGCMIGLGSSPEADILSAISHGQKLIETYSEGTQPLIIGLPTWNEITTSESDNVALREQSIDSEEIFELVAAIYLLSFPDKMAWVFPNCRVPKDVQVRSVFTAGCFTSTMVRLGPGAYLEELSQDDLTATFARSSVPKETLNRATVLKGEQFVSSFC
jgi:2-iminoacetate synthase